MERTDFDETMLTTLPHFIAVNYQRALDARQPQERTNQLVYLYDIVLRTITIILISQYLSQDRASINDLYLNDQLLNQFLTSALTLDGWQKIFFLILKVYEKKRRLFFMPKLYDLYWGTAASSSGQRSEVDGQRSEVEQVFAKLTQIALSIQAEQDLPRDEAGWSAWADEAWRLLQTLLHGLTFLGTYDLIRVLDFDDSSYRCELYKGLTATAESRAVSSLPRLRRGHLYIRDGSENLLSLHPLLEFWDEQEGPGRPTAREIAIYDHLIQDEELQYLLMLSNRYITSGEQRRVNAFLLSFHEIADIPPERPLSWLHLQEIAARITYRRMASVRDKFDQELYLTREHMRQEFKRFLRSDKHCFVLVGKSGVGKSNFLLAMGEELRRSSDDICVLMYDGANVKAEQTLSGMLNQDVGDYLHRPVEDIWREIAALPEMQGRTVLLCVDALNENPRASSLLEQLDELIQGPWPWLKVVFSCRPETLRTTKRGIKLAADLYYHSQAASSPAIETELSTPAVMMQDFTRRELALAYIKYQRFFKLKTNYEDLEPDVRKLLHEPLNLWLTAKTYPGKAIPRTLNVSEMVGRYVQALEETERLEQEDLDLLEKQLLPMMVREGHYSNELSARDIEAGGKKLRLAIYSEQVRAGRSAEQEQHDSVDIPEQNRPLQINQSFQNLLNADILVRRQQGREQKIAFKNERFYEYFVGEHIMHMSNDRTDRLRFFTTLIDAIPSNPFLWGAVRNALARELQERGPELLYQLCYTDKQRIKEMLVAAMIYVGQDDQSEVQALLERLLPLVKPAGILRRIWQFRRGNAGRAGADLKTRNARKIAIEVAGRLKQSEVLENAALQGDATIRAAAVRGSYYLWQHDRSKGFALLERLAEKATPDLIPNVQALESFVSLSLIIFGDHYQDSAVVGSIQHSWHTMLARLFRLQRRSARWKMVLKDIMREWVISFLINLVFRLFQGLPYSIVSYQGFEAFFQLDMGQKELYRHLVHYMNVDGVYDKGQMERDYLAALKIDNTVVGIITLMGLSAHACAAPYDFLPFLKRLFAQAQRSIESYPYLTVIANVAMDVLDRDPHNDEMFEFFTHTIEVLHECYLLHPETYHNKLAEAPRAAAMAPYIVAQYRRTGSVSTDLLETILQIELKAQNLRFFELFLLESELPQVAIEKQEPRAALLTLELFFNRCNDAIKQMVMQFLAHLYIYYPEEVEDFLEEQHTSHDFRLQVRTSESSENVGSLMGKRTWLFARDSVLSGSPTLRIELLQLFERAADTKNTRVWLDFMMRRLLNLIYGQEVVREPDRL